MANPSDNFMHLKANQTFIGPALEIDDLKVINTGYSLISAWKPQPEEIELLNRTGVVYIAVFGQGLPPLAVATDVMSLVGLKPSV